VSFFVIQGNDLGQRFKIPGQTVTTIGRDPTNHIQLHDLDIAPRHASVLFSKNGFQLIGNDHGNGFFVNDIQKKKCLLNCGDRVLLGKTLLLFLQDPANDPDDFSSSLVPEDIRHNKKLTQLERLAVVGRSMSTLSHHIKNILQGINGGSYLIQTGLKNHNEKMIRQGWTIIEKSQNRISKIIYDMLIFSKEREPAYGLGNITETIKDVIELIQFRAKEENIEIQFEADPVIPKFFYDSEPIYYAITNIVTNAIDAVKSTQKGLLQIHVHFDQKRSVVVIIIDDNGPGIPEPERQYLFQEFYSQKKSRGTGLGLSATNKIVQEHNGTIHIANSPLGGARFKIELPFKTER
jgi:signal transduction histidine kinase